ncbi:SGNH/GDSL hydrolase family protein [Streptomyces sp. NPDC001380]|uniref:SGNH/GDSL hydrolase family protein n=1 Tax=Streptomyces sp. NPDC001380 TaxID=3364566 RepID=UPI0036822935
MSRARVARRIAAAAAYGGGGIGLLGVGVLGLLVTEAKFAERAVGALGSEPPRADGVYGGAFADGPQAAAPPLVLAFLGDSTAAGLGVLRGHETPGALLAAGLASVAERRVRLVNAALSGARSADLDHQVDLVLEAVPDVAVVIVGANDVTHRVPAVESVRLLGDAVRRLRSAGCEVVVGTCPDLGTIEPVRPPLRWVARRLSRQLAAAQTIAVVEAGGRTVSLGSLLGPEFAMRRELFAADRYHPSAQGYGTAAMAVLPSLCAALGLWPEDRPDAARGEAVLPVAVAAAEAAGRSGTEVAAAAPGGSPGRWALVRYRRRRRLPAVGDGEPGSGGGGEPGSGGGGGAREEGSGGRSGGTAGERPGEQSGGTSSSSHAALGDGRGTKR